MLKVYSLFLDKVEVKWKTTVTLEHQRTIQPQVIHVGYPTMYRAKVISYSVWEIVSKNNFTTDISELVYINTLILIYQSSGKVNYSCPILKHKDRGISLDYIEVKITHFSISDCCNIISITDSDPLSAKMQWHSLSRVQYVRQSICRVRHHVAMGQG